MPIDADSTSVRQAVDYYRQWLEFRQRYLRVPGVQAAVYIDDRIALCEAYGHADLEHDEALTTEHLFRIASHSKTFTATAVFQLVERGVLRLDDAVRDWLPELSADAPLGYARVRELLAHAAGVFRDSLDGDFWQLWRPFPNRAELLELIGGPGTGVLERNERFKYSNIGYGVLGLILERATGLTYDALIRRDILEPLGLRDSGTEIDESRRAEYATGYTALAYANARQPIESADTQALAAATGCYATAADLVTYWSAHFHGDKRLLGDDAKRAMQQPMWDVHGKPGRRYAHGLAVVDIGERRMIGHGGGFPGHITSSVTDPRDRLAVSVLTNAIDGPAESLAHAGVRLIDLAGSASSHDDRLRRFTGRFATLWGVFDVVAFGDRAYLINPALGDPVEEAARLEPVDDHSLRVVDSSGYASYGELLRYEFDDRDRVRTLRGQSATTAVPLEDFGLPDVIDAP